MIQRFAFLVLTFISYITPLAAQSATAPVTVRVLLSSDDKIEHAGFYWAVKKGLFQANRLNVKLLTPQTQNSLNKLEYGEVDIAMESLPMALQKNQKTQNLALVKQISNGPSIALVSQNQSFKNIMSFDGQTLFYPSASDYLAARIWLSTEGLSVEGKKPKVTFRKYARILTDFTTGKISHAIVPISWLPMLHNKIVGNLRVFTPDFTKGATLGTGLYVTRKKYIIPAFKANLDLFLYSLDEGYRAVFANKKEAIDLLLTAKQKLYPDEILMKRLSLIEEAYINGDDFAKHYEHSLQTIMSVEAVSEIKEYPKKAFLVAS